MKDKYCTIPCLSKIAKFIKSKTGMVGTGCWGKMGSYSSVGTESQLRR